jgi:hypothetical protein
LSELSATSNNAIDIEVASFQSRKKRDDALVVLFGSNEMYVHIAPNPSSTNKSLFRMWLNSAAIDYSYEASSATNMARVATLGQPLRTLFESAVLAAKQWRLEMLQEGGEDAFDLLDNETCSPRQFHKISNSAAPTIISREAMIHHLQSQTQPEVLEQPTQIGVPLCHQYNKSAIEDKVAEQTLLSKVMWNANTV